jgi:hypothetical protein
MERLRANVDKIRGPGGWDNLPGPVKTALYDISINSGPNVFDEDNTPKPNAHRDRTAQRDDRHFSDPATWTA